MKKPKSKLLTQVISRFRVANYLNQHPEENLSSLAEKKENAISRKEFISKMGKIGLYTATIGGIPLLTNCNDNNGKTGKSANKGAVIAIIGGGISGLNCAYQFMKNGFDATIYEGSFRVGGRVLTHYGDALENGVHPEFGGMFIDTAHEEMHRLVKEFGLETFNLLEESNEKGLVYETFHFEGKHFTEKEIIREFKKIAPLLDKDANSLGENYDTEDARRLDYIPLSTYIADLQCAQWLKDILTVAFLAEYGLETKDQSTLNMLSMLNTKPEDDFELYGESDEIYRIKGGCSLLTKAMKEKLGDRILTEYALTKISNQGKRYQLSFKDKPDVLADYVVLTLPFTKLREVELDLKELTPEKKKAINEMGYGQNNKIVLGYKSQAWREDGNKFQGNMYNNAVTNGLDASDVKKEDNPAGNYLLYLGGDESLRLANLAVKAPHAPPNHVWKTTLPESEINKYVDELDKIFPKSKEKFNNKHVFACWSSYPWVYGSYTCFKPGQWTEIMPYVDIPMGNIHFAGEHCSIPWQGFMNGGAETGRLSAEKIMALIKQNG
jgi:monoamine oxidase